MTYPCPLCHAAAQKRLDDAPDNSMAIMLAEIAADEIVQESTSTTPRERAEHLERIHGWRVRR